MTDEQGRLFGKISIVDIFAILAVILISLSLYMRMDSHGAKILTASYSDKYQYTIVAENVSPDVVNALQKSVGDNVFDKTGKKIGTLDDIATVSPSLIPLEQKNGDVITVQHPEQSDVRITVKCEATKAHAGILAEGNCIVSNGLTIDFETKYTLASGRISNVQQIK